MVEYNPLRARQGGYDFVSNALDDISRSRAGRQYAEGNVADAAGTLARGGLIGDSVELQRQQSRAADSQRELEAAERAEEAKWLVQAATGLRSIPYEQRKAAYQAQVRPLLMDNGFDDEELERIDAADYSDSELDALLGALGGQVSTPYANDRAGPNGTVLRPDRYTGEYSSVYEAPFDPRVGAPTGYMWTDETRTRQVPIPGGSADPSQAGALAASKRAPARGRSSVGGSRGGSSGGPSASSAPAGRPWERKW